MRPMILILLVAAAVTVAAAVLMNRTAPGTIPADETKRGTAERKIPTQKPDQNESGDIDPAVTDEPKNNVPGPAGDDRKSRAKTGDDRQDKPELPVGLDGDPAKTIEKEPAPPTLPTITFPGPVKTARFGMTPADIKRRFDIAWQRQRKDEIMLVHKTANGASARLHFPEDQGLQKLEMQYSATDPEQISQLYQRIRTEYQKRYGSLPESSRTRWTDGKIRVRIRRERTGVTLIFVPHRLPQ